MATDTAVGQRELLGAFGPPDIRIRTVALYDTGSNYLNGNDHADSRKLACHGIRPMVIYSPKPSEDATLRIANRPWETGERGNEASEETSRRRRKRKQHPNDPRPNGREGEATKSGEVFGKYTREDSIL
jgi:hypothetical protein